MERFNELDSLIEMLEQEVIWEAGSGKAGTND